MDKEVWLRGELVCLNCGRFLGIVQGHPGHGLRVTPDPSRPLQAAPVRCAPSHLCCGRCGGRAIVEELEQVRKEVRQKARAA